jgi:ribose 5-phosphate isomerase A
MEELKRIAAHHSTTFLSDGMLIGLGTGSTVRYAIDKISKLVTAGLDIVAVPTSIETEHRARAAGIPLAELNDRPIDITIDGADQVDPKLNLIKGGGGALLREKMVALASERVIIIVDKMKMVDHFSYALPVEVVPFGWKHTAKMIKKLDLNPCIRQNVITDNKNFILDCTYETLDDVEDLQVSLNNIPGVVENGLFINLVSEVVVGTPSGPKTIRSN